MDTIGRRQASITPLLAVAYNGATVTTKSLTRSASQLVVLDAFVSDRFHRQPGARIVREHQSHPAQAAKCGAEPMDVGLRQGWLQQRADVSAQMLLVAGAEQYDVGARLVSMLAAPPS
jgi:hypothetical protein